MGTITCPACLGKMESEDVPTLYCLSSLSLSSRQATLEFQGLVAMRYLDYPQIYLNPRKVSKSLQVAPKCFSHKLPKEYSEKRHDFYNTETKMHYSPIAIANPLSIDLIHQWPPEVVYDYEELVRAVWIHQDTHLPAGVLDLVQCFTIVFYSKTNKISH